jgi:hypothetical protein
MSMLGITYFKFQISKGETGKRKNINEKQKL